MRAVLEYLCYHEEEFFLARVMISDSPKPHYGRSERKKIACCMGHLTLPLPYRINMGKLAVCNDSMREYEFWSVTV